MKTCKIGQEGWWGRMGRGISWMVTVKKITQMMRKLGGCWVKNRLRKWSTGSYAAPCLRRSLAEHTPVAEDEVVWGETSRNCADQREGVWSGKRESLGNRGSLSIEIDQWQIYIYIHIKSKKATVKIRRKFAELCSREPCLYRTYFKFMTKPRNQCCYRNKKLKYLIRHKSYQRAKKREHFSKNPLMSSRLLDSRGNMRIRGLTGRIVSQCWTLCNPDWE